MNNKHFFIIGAQRSGTTLLYKRLDEHPMISMAKPMRPEPKYFLRNQPLDYDDYLKTFYADAKKTQLLGEKSTSYYEFPQVAKKIKHAFPEAKIICLLRNPVERAISNYYFTKNFGLETRTLVEVFLQNVPNPKLEKKLSVDPFNYLGRGHYLKHLQPYIDLFGLEKVNIVLFEDFVHSDTTLLNLFTFLDVEPLTNPKTTLIGKVNSAKRADASTSNEVLEFLYNYFEQPNSQLENTFQLNLSKWRIS